jgi:hypothetical protein
MGKFSDKQQALAARLRALGYVSHVVHTPRYFIHGAVEPLS